MLNSKVAFTFVAFFQLYGVKLYGVVDTSVLILLGVFLFYAASSKKYISFDRTFLSIIFVLIIIFIYTLLLTISDGYYFVFRSARAVISTILLMMYLQLSGINDRSAIRILILCFAVHACMMVLQLLVPSIKEISVLLVGHDKELIALRVFGLVAAYDTAGAYLLFGMILSSYFVFIYKEASYFLYIVFFWLAGLASGRTFMILGTVLLVVLTYFYVTRVRGLYLSKYIIAFVAIILAIIFVEYAFPLLDDSIRFVLDDDYSPSIELSESEYYVGTLSVLFNQFMLPSSEWVFIFGGGEQSLKTDIGYIKLVHVIGILGLSIYCLFYYMMYYYVRMYNKLGARYIFLPLLVITFIYNFKILVFASRGYHEFILLVMLLLVSAGSRGKRNAIRVIA